MDEVASRNIGWKATARTARRAAPSLMVAATLLGVTPGMAQATAINVATSVAASSHPDHNCTGVTSSGFSCSRSSTNGSSWDNRYTWTYYNGSQRTFTQLIFNHATPSIYGVDLCDSRRGDNIRHSLEVRVHDGSTYTYWAPVESSSSVCTWQYVGNLTIDAYRVVTYSSGQFSHATVWCRACVPG